MKLPRFSIKKLMAIVAMVAVVVASLARPNYAWANFLSLTYILMLLIAPLGIILRRGPRQARWIGFGLFGWAFFLTTTFVADRYFYSTHPSTKFDGADIGFGLNTVWLNFCFVLISIVDFTGSICTIAGENLQEATTLLGETLSDLGKIDPFSGFVVALSLMGLAFALLGGQIARFLARGGPFDPPPTTPA
jgi:hypothetical protein